MKSRIEHHHLAESEIREGIECDIEDDAVVSHHKIVNSKRGALESDKFIPLMNDHHRKQLSRSLPLPLRHGNWKLLYSLVRDGSSFATLIEKVQGYQNTILILRTTGGVMCGGFAAKEWNAHTGGGYYGSGHSFLFSLPCPREQAENRTDENSEDNNNNYEHYYELILDHLLNLCAIEVCDGAPPNAPKMQIYKWTGKNRYIQFCRASDEKLAFGGGGFDGNFGLCLEGDFARGSSGWCETFGNEPLAGEQIFIIGDLELYGITSTWY